MRKLFYLTHPANFKSKTLITLLMTSVFSPVCAGADVAQLTGVKRVVEAAIFIGAIRIGVAKRLVRASRRHLSIVAGCCATASAVGDGDGSVIVSYNSTCRIVCFGHQSMTTVGNGRRIPVELIRRCSYRCFQRTIYIELNPGCVRSRR